ncbi:hypothetical protein FHQ08_03485 [Lactobacillus sp. CC-MHH1034]|uniref:hypothetical protein n=1 Tax=Agrilactobacillus fermenti TaxID=2586909 RepID=UPI001E2DA0FF|nr:hypothetical protein [Agrilactobacillus fermenti]MCD2255778.1 hypothetical protein [Agrilactobacillus fermenti]
MTYFEYVLRLRGFALRMLDQKQQDLNKAIWAFELNAYDKNGKPLVKKATDLFDYEREVNQVLGNGQENERVSELEARKRAADKLQRILNERRNSNNGIREHHSKTESK